MEGFNSEHLTVGSYIIRHDLNYDMKEVLEVESINAFDNVYIKGSARPLSFYDFDRTASRRETVKGRPLPLNHNWFEQLGFKEARIMGADYYIKGKLRIKAELGMYLFASISLNYVHELQNLYLLHEKTPLKINKTWELTSLSVQ